MATDSQLDPWKCVFASKTYSGIVYVFGGNDTKILNVSNVNDIRIVGEIESPPNEVLCIGILEVNKTLFIGIEETISVIDVTNIADPVWITSFTSSGETQLRKSLK